MYLETIHDFHSCVSQMRKVVYVMRHREKGTRTFACALHRCTDFDEENAPRDSGLSILPAAVAFLSCVCRLVYSLGRLFMGNSKRWPSREPKKKGTFRRRVQPSRIRWVSEFYSRILAFHIPLHAL